MIFSHQINNDLINKLTACIKSKGIKDITFKHLSGSKVQVIIDSKSFNFINIFFAVNNLYVKYNCSKQLRIKETLPTSSALLLKDDVADEDINHLYHLLRDNFVRNERFLSLTELDKRNIRKLIENSVLKASYKAKAIVLLIDDIHEIYELTDDEFDFAERVKFKANYESIIKFLQILKHSLI